MLQTTAMMGRHFCHFTRFLSCLSGFSGQDFGDARALQFAMAVLDDEAITPCRCLCFLGLHEAGTWSDARYRAIEAATTRHLYRAAAQDTEKDVALMHMATIAVL